MKKGIVFAILNTMILSALDLNLNGTISNEVSITTQYNTITNYATFTNTGTSIMIKNSGGGANNFINFGNTYTFWTENAGSGNINIYNYRYIKNGSNGNFALSGANIKIHLFHLKINQNASSFIQDGNFSNFEESIKQSHILVSGSNDGKLTMANNGKIILSFGDRFELGKAYNSAYIFLDCDNSNGSNNIQNCMVKSHKGEQVNPFLTTYNNGLFNITTSSDYMTINIDDDEYASSNTIYKSA